MDCRLFTTQMREAKNAASEADYAILKGDSKKASFALDDLEKIVREARENLGRVGA